LSQQAVKFSFRIKNELIIGEYLKSVANPFFKSGYSSLNCGIICCVNQFLDFV